MKHFIVCLSIAGAACFAQETVTIQSDAVAVGGAAHTMTFTAGFVGFDASPDGRVVKNAPFAADFVNEHVQTLADGNHVRSSNNGKLYRDSYGRARRDTTINLVGPWAAKGEAHTHVLISDPVAQVSYDLDQEQKTAHRLAVARRTLQTGPGVALSITAAEATTLRPKLTTAPGSGDVKTEDLGTQSIEGVMAQGTRTTVTIPAGAVGNEQPIQTVSERWYSPELETVVLSTVHDPRMGDSTYKLLNIVRGEQPASVFEVPSDYHVVDPPHVSVK